MRLIQRSLVIGFSLDELARVFRERVSGGAPCRKVRGIVQGRLDQLNQQLLDLNRLKRDLEAMLNDWDVQLARTPPGERAYLLDRLERRQ